ncbi:ferritin-like domain-containing protein [Streptomyces sp. NPDC057743]|uniref:ferritin-like domain-containing protein n=1 Tax=Streptomyces sp. NPDC057743 TaxID=3346236 RepID=UPI00368F6069
MFSARSLFQEIVDHDDSYRLFCSIAASGESQGGGENGRIAALLPQSQRDLTPKAARHGAERLLLLRRFFGVHPELGRAARMICQDEERHLAYCHEELLRLTRAGHGRRIQRALRECALAEIAVHRDVSLAVMAHMGRILGWPAAKSALLRGGILAVYGYERLPGWRRMVSLTMPARRDALGGPADPAPEFA